MKWISPPPFEDEAAAESYFFTALTIIARNNNCEIEKVDLKNNIVHLSGPQENQVECAKEIAEKLNQYLK